MHIKPIFISWEKLRLFYNLILLAVFILITVSSYLLSDIASPEMPISRLLVQCAILALAANLFYFAGPLLDGYLTWLEVRFKYQRHFIFIAGLLISVAIEVAYLAVTLSPF